MRTYAFWACLPRCGGRFHGGSSLLRGPALRVEPVARMLGAARLAADEAREDLRPPRAPGPWAGRLGQRRAAAHARHVPARFIGTRRGNSRTGPTPRSAARRARVRARFCLSRRRSPRGRKASWRCAAWITPSRARPFLSWRSAASRLPLTSMITPPRRPRPRPRPGARPWRACRSWTGRAPVRARASSARRRHRACRP